MASTWTDVFRGGGGSKSKKQKTKNKKQKPESMAPTRESDDDPKNLH
jgi:hypothetical protein